MPDWITREAYSHEVSSCRFWPGGGENETIFYAYAYPTPDGFAACAVRSSAAVHTKDFGVLDCRTKLFANPARRTRIFSPSFKILMMKRLPKRRSGIVLLWDGWPAGSITRDHQSSIGLK